MRSSRPYRRIRRQSQWSTGFSPVVHTHRCHASTAHFAAYLWPTASVITWTDAWVVNVQRRCQLINSALLVPAVRSKELQGRALQAGRCWQPMSTGTTESCGYSGTPDEVVKCERMCCSAMKASSAYCFRMTMCHAIMPKMVTKWKHQNNVRTLYWPTQTPDLNLIENFWHKVPLEISKRPWVHQGRADWITHRRLEPCCHPRQPRQAGPLNAIILDDRNHGSFIHLSITNCASLVGLRNKLQPSRKVILHKCLLPIHRHHYSNITSMISCTITL